MNNQNRQKKGFVERFKSMFNSARKPITIKHAEEHANTVIENRQQAIQNELAGLQNRGIASRRIAVQEDKIHREALASAVMKKQRNEIRKELSKMQKNAMKKTGVSASEKELATYLVDRAAMNKPVEGNQLAVLRSGNQSVNEARSKLNAGRGNVDTDINRRGHKHESTRRTKIGRDMLKDLLDDTMTVDRKGRLRSSVAELCRAGNCGEHAHVTTHVHAEKLSGKQTVHKVSHTDVDHAWSELRLHPKGTPSDVIMDAWAKGPAVLREDSNFADDVHEVKTGYSYNKNTGPSASHNVQMQTEHLKNDAKIQKRINSQLQHLNNTNYKYSDKSVWAPTSVLSKDFRDEASDKLNSLEKKNPVLQDILKAGVARNLGSNIKQARDFASGGRKK